MSPFVFLGVSSVLFLFLTKIPVFNADSVDPDQTLCSVCALQQVIGVYTVCQWMQGISDLISCDLTYMGFYFQKNLRCKPTFREAGVRNYREVRILIEMLKMFLSICAHI